MVSMASEGYSQPTNFLGNSDRSPVNCVTTPVMISIPPEEITAQFVDVMTNFLREKHGLHCIGRDRGDRSFDKGGPASHRKIFGLTSFNSRTNIIHQILIGVSSVTGVKISVPR